MTSVPASRLIEEARKLCGTPWRHQGRTRRGIDCIGLIALAARAAGVDVFAACGLRDSRNYGRKADPETLELIRKHLRPTEIAVPGCLLFFRFHGESTPRHFGVFTERGTVIHAEAKSRMCVVEHGYRAHWVKWTHSMWLLPGVDYA